MNIMSFCWIGRKGQQKETQKELNRTTSVELNLERNAQGTEQGFQFVELFFVRKLMETLSC